MNGTDELREYARIHQPYKSELYNAQCADEITAIADRIDAEHEEALNKISRAGQLLADAEKDRDENYANWQDCKQKVLQGNITFGELNAEIERLKDVLARCVELPKDADGEYIRIGDMMDSKVDHLFDGRPFEVRALVLCEDGWEAADGRFGNRYEPNSLRHHHHAPTVEDVLREFALAVCKDEALTIRKGVMEEYASKLQLREDA